MENQELTLDIFLGATLMRLARGSHYDHSGERFGLSKSTMNKYHPKVLQALWVYLHHTLVMPSSAEALNRISEEFQEYCQLPNCIGVIDGTHIPIEAPERFFRSSFLFCLHFNIFKILCVLSKVFQKIIGIENSFCL